MQLREFVRRLDLVEKYTIEEPQPGVSYGHISPAVDVKVVYDCLFGGGRPVTGHEVYCLREEFFSVTYPTAGMVRWLSVLFGVLAGQPGKNVFVLPAYLGAGKSHFLAFVLHVTALYRECRGFGQCVAKELKRYGIEVELPDLEGDLRVVLFHGGYATSPPWGSGVPTKDLLRRELEGRGPVLYLFDETGMFDNKFQQFADYMQLLSEVFLEAGPGRALVVSYSLASGQSSPPSLERLKRVAPLIIEMDAVKNIVHIVRRWAGIDKVPPFREFKDLEGPVPGDKVREFYAKVVETYPFNPVTLETLLLLAEESLAKASKIQLTRELLKTALSALKNAVKRDGGLVVHGDLPDPKIVLMPPTDFEKFWNSIIKLYRKDEEEAGNDFVLHSVLRHVIYRSFVGRLMPMSGIYPDEAALILGNYDVILGALSVINAVRRIGEFRVQRTASGYVYLPLPDEYDALAKALVYVSEEEGAKAVHDEVEQITKNDAPKRFKRVAVLGWKEGKTDGVTSFDDAKKAADYVGERDFSALLVDLRGVAQVPRRNNLFVVRVREGTVPVDIKEFLGKFAVPPDDLSEALYMLGRLKVAVDRVKEDLESYFPDIKQVEDRALRQALEDGVKVRLDSLKEVARKHIRNYVGKWLDEVFLGRRLSASGGLNYLTEYLRNSNPDAVIKWVLDRARVFMKIGDLWDQWLNSDDAPPFPLSFNDFVEKLLRMCREECNCVVREGGEYRWILKEGGCFYELRDPRNAEVALAYVEGSANESVIEQFLAYLDSLGSVEFAYQRLGGEEVRRSLSSVLRDREDWIYLKHAKYRIEKREKKLDIKINGVATTLAEVNPGDEVVVAVESDEVIAHINWEFAGVQHEDTVNDVFYQFKVRVGNDPQYVVKIVAKFADGSVVDRDVYLNVRVKRKREISTAVVNVGDVVVAVSASSAAEALRLLEKFERLKEDIVEVVEVRANETSEDLNLRLEFRGRRGHLQQARRLIKAVEQVTQNVGITVKFKEPVTIDKSRLESLGKGAFLWTKIVEE